MAGPWIFLDAAAQSTAPGAITNVATTIVLTSSASFGNPTGGDKVPLIILDAGNGSWNPLNPLATPYEYVDETTNVVGTNTITITRAQGGTTAKAFSAGAIIAATAQSRMFAAGTGAFVRIDTNNVTASSLNSPPGRWVGSWSTAGAPTGITSILGDYGFDANGMLWTCTAAGTPGTWKTAANFFKAWAINNANQAGVASATFTKVQLQSKNYDPAGSFDAVTNYRYTVASQAPGYYSVAGVVAWSLGAQTGRAMATIFKNGAEVGGTRGSQMVSTNSIVVEQPTTPVILSLVGGDYIELYAFHAAAAAATVVGSGNDNCGLTIHYLSAP